MPVNVLQWCAGIGNFYKCTHLLIRVKCNSPFNLDLMQILTMLFYSYFSAKLLIQHGDIESNPGPSKKNQSFDLSYCPQDAQKIIYKSICH